MRHAWAIALACATVISACTGKLGETIAAGSAHAAPSEWSRWMTLDPVWAAAKPHVDRQTRELFERVAEHLGDSRALAADRELRRVSTGADRHWVAVARANLASLYFTACIRGVALRLATGSESDPKRDIDMSPDTAIGADDLAMGALLANTTAALQVGEPTLGVYARIARARLAALATSCPPDKATIDAAQRQLESDLAVLAAQGQLTPDLAFLWAGVQLRDFTPAAAKPFLVAAKSAGFVDPALDMSLAEVALALQEYEEAEQSARDSERHYAALGDTRLEARAHAILGEIARARGDHAGARAAHERALAKDPAQIAAILGMTQLIMQQRGSAAATEFMRERVEALLASALASAMGISERVDDTVMDLEALIMSTSEDTELTLVCRDALLLAIESEPTALRRGLRFFYAATLDARLGEYEAARGHAASAEAEFDTLPEPPPVHVRQFLDRLHEVAS